MTKSEIADNLVSQRLSLSVFTREMAKNGMVVVQPDTYVPLVFKEGFTRFFPKIDDMDIVIGGSFG